MSELSPAFRTPQWNGLFAPLNLAAYATWMAIAVGPAMGLLHGEFVWSSSTRAGAAGLIVFLALYVCRCIDPGNKPIAIAERYARVNVMVQAFAALIACWGLLARSGMTSKTGTLPALLIIVAAEVAVFYPPRATVLLLLAINLPLAALLIERWELVEGVTCIVAFGGFQAFAAFTMTYAKRAEHAREEALRINAELMATRQLLEEGTRADERLRLSHDLHDLTGHKLTALKMQLALHRRQAPADDASALETCERLADELLTDIRGVVSVLRPHEGVDLQNALRALDPDLPRPKVIFELDPDIRVADMRSAEIVLRCAQEGLTNALRHSAAATVTVSLGRTPQGLLLAVIDDGKGRIARLSTGNGLRGLRERLTEAGGRLELSDHAPQGIALRALLPELEAASEEPAPSDQPHSAPSMFATLEALHNRHCLWKKYKAAKTLELAH